MRSEGIPSSKLSSSDGRRVATIRKRQAAPFSKGEARPKKPGRKPGNAHAVGRVQELHQRAGRSPGLSVQTCNPAESGGLKVENCGWRVRCIAPVRGWLHACGGSAVS